VIDKTRAGKIKKRDRGLLAVLDRSRGFLDRATAFPLLVSLTFV